MPANRNALVRYKTIDKCLQNRFRKWTLEDLIEACSDALYEYEGIEKGVSKRTVQADIQIMRSDKLGYNAPIIVLERKYYTYEEPDYSITNIPLTDQDLTQLSETVAFLKQFQGFSHFQELDGVVQKLEAHVYAKKTKQKTVIDFEKNENLKGLEYLDQLYQAIVKQQVMEIQYQSFKAKSATTFLFHAYLLKEYNNRWFLLGIKETSKRIITMALDRIQSLKPVTGVKYIENDFFDPSTYFKDVIGVTVISTAPQAIELYIAKIRAPYVLTKPLHPSQKLISEEEDGIIISLNVKFNLELESKILSFGEAIKVLKPRKLQERIQKRLSWAIDNYEEKE